MRNLLFGLLTFVVITLSACAASPSLVAMTAPAATAAPTFPAVFPSTTPVRLPSPAFTPALASPTPLPPPNALVAAFGKLQAATKYRVAMSLSVKPGNAPAFAQELIGEVNGGDVRYAYQLGGETIEYVAARGQYYVKGARNVGVPTLTKWYTVTPDLADAARPPFSPDDLLNEFAAQTARLPFQSTAREAERLDGQNCQVWRYAPKTPAETGISAPLGLEQETSAFGALDQAELKVWVCDDGVVHQIGGDFTGHNPKKATDKGTAKWLLHIWDTENAAIKIDPPPNAEPFRLAVPTR